MPWRATCSHPSDPRLDRPPFQKLESCSGRARNPRADLQSRPLVLRASEGNDHGPAGTDRGGFASRDEHADIAGAPSSTVASSR